MIARRTFQVFALCTLVFPALGTYALGPTVAGWIPADLGSPVPTLLKVLAYVLVLLGCVLVWALLLLPLRRRAGFVPLRDELRAGGGLDAIVAAERRKLEARRDADDPRFHAMMAGVSALLGVISLGLTWALWTDGFVVGLPAIGAAVCPALALYHAIRWLRHR